MTRGSKTPIVSPLKDPESAFHKKKNKNVGESSNTFESNKFEHFEKTPSKKEVGYELETKNDSEDEIHSELDEMANITHMTMEEYKKRMHDDTWSGLVHHKIPIITNFELKGHILFMLIDIPFYGKYHKDAYKCMDKVNYITNYLNVPNVTREMVLLWMLPVTFKGEAKDWLKALPPGAITTWAQPREGFIQQFRPPSKVAKLKKNIANFE